MPNCHTLLRYYRFPTIRILVIFVSCIPARKNVDRISSDTCLILLLLPDRTMDHRLICISQRRILLVLTCDEYW